MQLQSNRFFLLSCFLMSFLFTTMSYAANKVVVIPLFSDSNTVATPRVYENISGVWFGKVTFGDFEYSILWTNNADAAVGEVAGSAAYIGGFGADFNCSAVQTRVSESGYVYNFTENLVSNEGCNIETAPVTLTYNPTNDTVTYVNSGSDIEITATLVRLKTAPVLE